MFANCGSEVRGVEYRSSPSCEMIEDGRRKWGGLSSSVGHGYLLAEGGGVGSWEGSGMGEVVWGLLVIRLSLSFAMISWSSHSLLKCFVHPPLSKW